VRVSDGTRSQAIESGSDVILAALHKRFAGVTRLATRVANEPRVSGTKRLTADDVIATRVSMLRKRDPQLDAAVDALDLRLID